MAKGNAFVTGASRGIGKAIAVELAEAGYDVAITARTVHEGERARAQLDAASAPTRARCPGSLDEHGRARARHRASAASRCRPTCSTTRRSSPPPTPCSRSGASIDVLVNNGRYVGPGHMDLILDTPVRILRDHFEANVLAPVVLIKAIVPQMIERGGGTVINITSGAAYSDPPARRGRRAAGVSATARARARCTASPGSSRSRRGDRASARTTCSPASSRPSASQQDMGAFGFDASSGAPAAVVGKVCVWLLESPDADALNGQNIEAQDAVRASSACSRAGRSAVDRSFDDQRELLGRVVHRRRCCAGRVPRAGRPRTSRRRTCRTCRRHRAPRPRRRWRLRSPPPRSEAPRRTLFGSQVRGPTPRAPCCRRGTLPGSPWCAGAPSSARRRHGARPGRSPADSKSARIPASIRADAERKRLGGELVLAAGEVVVQRAPRGAALLEDLREPRGVQALDPEEVLGGAHHSCLGIGGHAGILA